MKYAIADHFPKAALENAANRRYSKRDMNGAPRTAGGYCPLGTIFCVLGWRKDWAPDEFTVAELILNHLIDERIEDEAFDFTGQASRYEAIQAEAHSFIDDWDDGKITDLRDAFGLTEAQS